ncbi:hypothetical protein AT5G28462 [Arabidopsis thaliana]|uniref:Uncharacterized protein n=1 Tax=Arabidopsis thaliana TaxID=3702 RepID=A0A1P8BD96_ARATH|nr:uncharacterized protein AT5G28462 [Arabidopsis thaliana]ANM69557.1 hypothetical protein AT5G28462 [Arabidopsis thaliana]|eukprot:NP_001331226.1 hypothetical protein AT5G28462 [Arabidopsis thaliana]
MARLKRILYAYQVPIVPHPSHSVLLSLFATHTYSCFISEIVASQMFPSASASSADKKNDMYKY